MVNNSVTKPPIKILRPLFTLQLLILLKGNPYHATKSFLRAKINIFVYFDLGKFHHHRISSELSRKVRVSEESLILRFGGQVSSRFKLKWVEEVKLDRESVFDDCSIA